MSGLEVDLQVPGRVHAQVHAEAGDVVAVIGPNGAGKSSLVKAIAGTVPATGSVLLGGRDLATLPIRERRVGLVFQDQLLFPHLDALRNVAYGPRARGVARATAYEVARSWLERVGAGDLADRRPGELSGGQAQRVAIARALASDPDLLLLDEPMSGLDVGVAIGLRLELSCHLAEYAGITLLVTHDAIDALTVANRVLVIEDGQVVQSGTPAEVAQHPATDHVARLVGLNVVRGPDRTLTFAPSAVALWAHEPVGSPRLRWSGEVAQVTGHGAALRVVVRTDGGGPELIADVTPAAATELGLAPGRVVWATVKETSVQSFTDRSG
ncbi:ABC transporter ATP-binding protein [Nocardioides sp. AE5]|uniref:sulfate/molybdate ABC transporter ATP-binding protein n=1 Tax=Nocardioides sp. AE5 TaxID=2962573 RepID=UPI00288115E7|nr:ABC transporter ATP-binding protein [Nocardioides sp. AE5]MDT0202176.1 ABC transporter ATP-binding protein [Nocardioides sp. AE5]